MSELDSTIDGIFSEPEAQAPGGDTPAAPAVGGEGAPAPASEAQPAVPEAAPAAAEAAKAEPGFVPLAAVLDERERRQKLEREVETLRAAQPKPQAAPVPSVYDDPDGFQAYVARQVDQVAQSTRLDMSHRFAEQAHGADTLAAAKAWGETRAAGDPTFAQRFLASPDPFNWIVAEHRRDQAISTLGDKTFEDAARDWAISQGFAAPASTTTPAGQAPAASAPATPTRSLASTPSAGGPQTVPVGPLAALEAVFPPG